MAALMTTSLTSPGDDTIYAELASLMESEGGADNVALRESATGAQSVVDAMVARRTTRGGGGGDDRPAYSGWLRKQSFWGWKTKWVTVRLGGGGEASSVEYGAAPGDCGVKRVSLERTPFSSRLDYGAVVHRKAQYQIMLSGGRALKGIFVAGNAVIVAPVGRCTHQGNEKDQPAVVFTVKKKTNMNVTGSDKDEEAVFRTIPGTTTPALVTALACLGWPVWVAPQYREGANVDSGLYPCVKGGTLAC